MYRGDVGNEVVWFVDMGLKLVSWCGWSESVDYFDDMLCWGVVELFCLGDLIKIRFGLVGLLVKLLCELNFFGELLVVVCLGFS